MQGEESVSFENEIFVHIFLVTVRWFKKYSIVILCQIIYLIIKVGAYDNSLHFNEILSSTKVCYCAYNYVPDVCQMCALNGIGHHIVLIRHFQCTVPVQVNTWEC